MSFIENRTKLQKIKYIFSTYLIVLGSVLIIFGLIIFVLTFYPLIKEELRYQISIKTDQISVKLAEIKPVDVNFGIVIPKIRANARIITGVDPYNPQQYQWQLTKGIAQAKGSTLPGQPGNIFLFAHSSDNWYNANRYNAVFYLINKLKKDDEIFIYYKNKRYKYIVSDSKIVNPDSVNYIKGNLNKSTLTLMTCWPPGTNLKRLIVTADYKI